MPSEKAPPHRGRPKKKRTSSASSAIGSEVRERQNERQKKSDRRMYGSIALLAVGLGGLVWWSLPGNHAGDGGAGVGANQGATDEAGAAEDDPLAELADGGMALLERPTEATAVFAVISRKPDDVTRQLATVSEIGKRLEARHCGNACDAVRKFIEGEDNFEVDVVKTDDLILPPADTMDVIAPGLTPREREEARGRVSSVRVRTHGPFTKDQLPARAAFAAAAVLAEGLDGFVYDEVSRRLETEGEFGRHVVTAPLGEPAFARRHVVVQLYRQEDGTARLLSLGMARFGSPDVSLRGANMGSAPLLAEVLNAALSKLAFDAKDPSVSVTLEDVARIVGKKPSELNPNPPSARPALLVLVEADRVEGDADNAIAELVPFGGSTTENWDGVLASLFGTPPSVQAPADDAELADVAKNARKSLPGAIKRFAAGEGELFLKGPFVIPPESRVDGGSATELLWVSAASCDDRRCTGTLSNEPSYATNLAAGKTTSLERSDVTDWMIRQRDGGTAGGDSIKVLRARSR